MSDAPRGVSDEPELTCQVEPAKGLIAFWWSVKWKIKNILSPDKPEDSNLYQHAVRELKAAGYFKEESPEDGGLGMNKMMREDVLKLIAEFCKQGHSGMSAGFCISLFSDLAMYKPLLPLQGTDDEWMDVSEYGCGEDEGFVKQNVRCSHVFMNKHGAYDIDAVIYREPDGCTYSKGGARHYITFPYTPKREYIDVPFEHDDPRAVQEPQLTLALGI